MNKLIITAHPSKHGFTHQLADSFIRGALKNGHTAELIDLYQEPQQDFLRFEDPKNIESNQLRDKYQEKIKQADELVLIFPVWWTSPPAILKNFIDNNLSAGFAFRYHRGRPRGLLSPRTARVMMTGDGPKIFYYLMFAPIHLSLGLTTLWFCGFKIKSFCLFDRMRKRTEAKRQKWLNHAYHLGTK